MANLGDDWMELLIAETHDYVDEQRRLNGSKPYKWHKPNTAHVIRKPLASLVRLVTNIEDTAMRDLSCRSLCGFTASGADPMKQIHDHYSDHPDHKISYYAAQKLREGKTVKRVNQAVAEVVSKPQRTRRPRINHPTPEPVVNVTRALSAMEQFANMLSTFDAEIRDETSTIDRLREEIDNRSKHLQELCNVRDRLAGIPASDASSSSYSALDAVAEMAQTQTQQGSSAQTYAAAYAAWRREEPVTSTIGHSE